ncbi:pentapeptide repeat-containing protein [Oscillatoria sp. CS-180]|uniref:pentapeptide repeat-containing protein n=1 Tax=Oscillatoria sp. CS-180 TaxID=3021720 RepID=UPI002330E568|nr:pentapeptide repeat-containing protein [Oscillatoria sp. CS-180]MDB9527718.1 pentapeptide repeat-containing protein [Oscillatoria sp. CS-180]
METVDFQVILEQYQSGERQFHSVVIDEADGFECDLQRIELIDAVISNAYLPYGNLSRANLRGLTIKRGNLGDVKLFSADLTKAILVEINLIRVDLRYACLEGANLQGSDLSNADLQEANLRGANLRGANLKGANLFQAQLEATCLQGAALFRAVNVDLSAAICDRSTIMPDGHYYS